MEIINVALIGLFQEGKSLTLNCLVGNYVSEIGIGLATTREIKRFHFSEADILISDTPGFNSTGKDEAKDENVAQKAIDEADFLLIVIPNCQMNQAVRAVLKKTVADKPFVILINCRAQAGRCLLQDPLSNENMEVTEIIESQLKSDNLEPQYIDSNSKVWAYNPAWYWYEICNGKSILAEDNKDDKETAALQGLRSTIASYRNYCEDEEISAEDFIEKSRLKPIREFLTNIRTTIENIENQKQALINAQKQKDQPLTSKPGKAVPSNW